MTRNIFFSVVLSLICLTQSLCGEIVWVKIYWQPTQCPSCFAVLQRRFDALEAVARADFNFALSMADLRWKPNQPYEDRLVRTPVAWAGLTLRDVRIKLRGTIVHDGQNVYIVSIGDGTSFPLVSQPSTSSKYFVQSAISSYALDPVVKEQLLAAQASFQVVSIEGTLINPYRPPVYLMVEKLEFPNIDAETNGKSAASLK